MSEVPEGVFPTEHFRVDSDESNLSRDNPEDNNPVESDLTHDNPGSTHGASHNPDLIDGASNPTRKTVIGVEKRIYTDSDDEEEFQDAEDASAGIEPKDIELVLSQAAYGTSRASAIQALKAHNGDVVNAIMGLEKEKSEK